MSASRILLAACFLVAVGATQQASAQVYNPGRSDALAYQQQFLFNRPTVSPYLNLLNSNNAQVSQPTYQSLVRPLLEQRQSAQFQQRQIGQINQQVNNIDRSRRNDQQGASTGHPTRFMTYSHYYPGLSR